MDEDGGATHLGSADELRPCMAMCCVICSAYCDWPECIGYRVKGTCLCYSIELLACKPACECCGEINPQLKKNPNTCCVICDGTQLCVSPSSCCDMTGQLLCVDFRCAFPCQGADGDVPCVFTLLPCCICCYNYQCKVSCCDSIGSLKAKIQDGGAPELVVYDEEKVAAPPITVQMIQ